MRLWMIITNQPAKASDKSIVKAKEKAGHSVAEFEEIRNERVEQFADSLRRYRKISPRAGFFANRHYDETTVFLPAAEKTEGNTDEQEGGAGEIEKTSTCKKSSISAVPANKKIRYL